MNSSLIKIRLLPINPFISADKTDQDLLFRHKKALAREARALKSDCKSVGVPGFEPGTSNSRSWRANRTALHPVQIDRKYSNYLLIVKKKKQFIPGENKLLFFRGKLGNY